MDNEILFKTLKIIRGRYVGCMTFWRLVKMFGDVSEALKNFETYNLRKNPKNPIVQASDEDVIKEIQRATEYGAGFLTFFDEGYPYLLKQIHNPPPVLTYLGNPGLLNGETVAIVGARNASVHGLNFAKKIAKDLGSQGYIVVSGLARGIDTSAHIGSVDTGTIAVLAGGIDNIYPAENEGLYSEISKKGLILSELAFGVAPRIEHFPARNRIISGLSKGVLVIEAGLRSGSIYTANQAIEQNRELFVTPGAPYDPRCEGSNKLLKDGAILASSAKDIIEELKDFKVVVRDFDDLLLKDDENEYTEDLYSYNFEEIENNFDNEDIESDKRKVLKALNQTPVEIEILNEILGMDVNRLNSILMELELEEEVIFEYGKVSLK